MLTEHELIEASDDVLLVFFVLVVQVLDELSLDETLLIQSLLVLEDLQGNMFSLFVIVTFEHDAEAAFTKLLDDLVAVRQVLVETTEVFVRVRVEAIVCLFIEDAHFRLTSAHG